MKVKLLILTVCLITILPIEVKANGGVKIDGVYYTFDYNKNTAEVSEDNKKVTSGDIVIPNTVKAPNGKVYTVTSIAFDAFYECKNLTSVTISDSIKFIDGCAFWGCSGLKKVVLPSYITTIKSNTFSGCTSLTSIKIPASVTTIENDAFGFCYSLDNVFIPKTVETMYRSAFESCTINNFTIEDGERSLNIKDNSITGYMETTKIYNIYIGRSFVLSGPNDSFYTNQYAKTVTIGKYVKRICDIAALDFLGNTPIEDQVLIEGLALGRNLTAIYSYIEDPVAILANFQNCDLPMKAILYVPKDKVSAYKSAKGWSDFGDNIKPMDDATDNINNISQANNKIIGFYNLSGEKVSSNSKGIIIIKYSNGITKKIIR